MLGIAVSKCQEDNTYVVMIHLFTHVLLIGPHVSRSKGVDMSLVNVMAWFGSIAGLIGSLLLAVNAEYSGWGFVAFLVSNAAWFYYGVKTKTWSMCVMQIGFTLTSILGIYRWMF
jgi:hypothetical protein